MLTHRPLEETDFAQCLAFLRQDYGFDGPLLARLPELWRVLHVNGAGESAVVEDTDRPFGYQIIAFGVSLFATEQFLSGLHADPEPYLARRVLKTWLAGTLPFLTAREIPAANTDKGLVLLALHSIYSPEITADEPFHRMARTMMEAFVEFHSGYRFRQLVSECYGPKRLGIHLGGGWKLRTDYSEHYARRGLPIPAPDARPYLVELSRADALANPGYAASTLFSYTPPRFYFRPSEQVLLRHALRGMTDEDLAGVLDLSLSTVKKRWRAIYDQAAVVLPDLLPPAAFAREQARGTEKRRRLLDYLRHHREELRPVSPPASFVRGGSRLHRNA